jgi:hypothetical protein
LGVEHALGYRRLEPAPNKRAVSGSLP